MCRMCRFVTQVHTWQCDLLPSSPSPTSGISPYAIPPQLPLPTLPPLLPSNRPQCVVLPSLFPCVLTVQHPLMSENMQCLIFCSCVSLLRMMVSRFIKLLFKKMLIQHFQYCLDSILCYLKTLCH